MAKASYLFSRRKHFSVLLRAPELLCRLARGRSGRADMPAALMSKVDESMDVAEFGGELAAHNPPASSSDICGCLHEGYMMKLCTFRSDDGSLGPAAPSAVARAFMYR